MANSFAPADHAHAQHESDCAYDRDDREECAQCNHLSADTVRASDGERVHPDCRMDYEQKLYRQAMKEIAATLSSVMNELLTPYFREVSEWAAGGLESDPWIDVYDKIYAMQKFGALTDAELELEVRRLAGNVKEDGI